MLEIISRPLCNKLCQDNLTVFTQGVGLQMHIRPSKGAGGKGYPPSLSLPALQVCFVELSLNASHIFSV